MLHSIDDYNQIYLEEFSQEAIEMKKNSLLDPSIKKYRVKTIKSGHILECECYPLWDCRREKRKKREKESTKSQRNLNDKNAVKNVIRLINSNFTDDDTWATFTYDNDHLPSSYEEAKKDMMNYLRRLKRKLKKIGQEELKYIFVTEFEDEGTSKKRIHHHIVLNVSDRDLIESTWTGGARTHARRLQEDDNGYEGLARYITKDPRGKKRYTPSRNLKKPFVTVSDYKMTRTKANRIAMYQETAKEEFEKMNPKYDFLACEIMISEFISGAYIYAKMRKKKGEQNAIGGKSKKNRDHRSYNQAKKTTN